MLLDELHCVLLCPPLVRHCFAVVQGFFFFYSVTHDDKYDTVCSAFVFSGHLYELHCRVLTVL